MRRDRAGGTVKKNMRNIVDPAGLFPKQSAVGIAEKGIFIPSCWLRSDVPRGEVVTHWALAAGSAPTSHKLSW